MEDDEESVLLANSSEGKDAGSGGSSLAGYDYQIDVSVWLALDLILASGLTPAIELEPGSEEDLEAQLADDEPEHTETHVNIDGYTLIVQVKWRTGDAWTVAGIKRLLKHGSVTRPSASERLTNSNARYLLVTSAALNGGTRVLRVKRAGSWPKESEMPPSISKILPINARGRVAIVSNLDEDRLLEEIKRLLIERFCIPNSRWFECLSTLRKEARLRILRVGDGRWHRNELEHIIREHDGYLASSPQLEHYVHPRNWQDLRDAMEAKNAAIIIGQSGTGKTLATNKLYEELLLKNRGLTRVPIRWGPQQLRDDRTPPPVLYDIEDPWGRYDFDPSSRPWNDELSHLLSNARADRMIIVTSRRDVAMSSHALKSVEPWIVPLEAEHYGKHERQQLYRTRIDALPRDVRLLAKDAESEVLDDLATPLEIEKFFDALRTMERPQHNQERGFIKDAINKAHERSIEHTVIQQIEHRVDVSAAAVIWGFLKASDRLSLRMLRDLELKLAERPSFEKGITPLVDFFVAARNLRLGAGDVTYYHPRVEAGVKRALENNTVPAKRALQALLDVLTDPDRLEENWGGGVAARIVAATAPIKDLMIIPRPKAAIKIDAWLSDRVADPSSKFSEYMSLAAAAGSAASNAAEFARFILHRPDKRFGFLDIWQPTDHPDVWYDRLRADSTIAVIVGRFIREMLPHDRSRYDLTLVDYLDRLAPDLTPVYLEAAAEIVHQGYIYCSDVVAAGALRDLDGFESIVDSAVKVLTPTSEELANACEIQLAITNEVYDGDYGEHFENDDGYTAANFLQGYADRVREVKGWHSLAKHRHAERLLFYWMRAFVRESKVEPPSVDELAGAFAATFGNEEEDSVWFVLAQHWDTDYQEHLLSRIREGSLLSAVRHAALACLVERAPNSLKLIVEELQQVGKDGRLVELIIDLSYLQNKIAGDGLRHEAAAIAALNHLDPALRELCEGVRESGKNKRKLQTLSPSALLLLAKPTPSNPAVCELRIRRYLELPSVRADIEWMLTYGDDHDICVEAIDAAIDLGMEDIVTGALSHKFSHVVAKALLAIGGNLTAPLPVDLLSLSRAEGSPVRKALVQLLLTKPHLNHLPVLLHLVQDQWSSSSYNYGENDDFPIARTAADAIRELGPLDSATLERLQEIALQTSDQMLRVALFEITIAQGGLAFQERLFELAVTPGRIEARHAAVRAMLRRMGSLELIVTSQITTDLLATCEPSIAVELTLIAACQLSIVERMKIASGITANLQRRALVLLMLWPKVNPCEISKSTIEQLLDGHPALEWVNAGPVKSQEDSFIADLGDPAICREILEWLKPEEAKNT